MAARRKLPNLTLAEFARYLSGKQDEALGCYRILEALREPLTGAFREEMRAWQQVFSRALPALREERANLPASFAAHVDRVEQEELERLRGEIAELADEIERTQARADHLLAAAQAETDSLRTLNPKLGQKEQELQAQAVAYQNAYAEAYDTMDQVASEATLPWLTRFGEMRRLSKTQNEAKRKQEDTLGQLRKIRQDWLERVQEAGERQSELREEWQQAGVRLAEAQTKHDHLQENLETLAEQDGFRRVLEELTEPPAGVSGELGELLADLAARNVVRTNYERAMEVLAEFMGLTRGIGQGMTKFAGSLDGVIRTQRQHNLKQVRMTVLPQISQMLDSWGEVNAIVAPRKDLHRHPKELVAVLQPYVAKRFTDDNIKALFDNMGNELNRATAAWK